jgi:drug/metabolite transporter (DMT)-like permease
MNNFSIVLLTCSAFSAAAGQLLFRIGARDNETLMQFVNIPIALGLVLYAASTAIWIFTLSRESLVDVYAFTALTFVLVYLGGVLLLNEPIDLSTGAGVIFVLVGLYLIVRINNPA